MVHKIATIIVPVKKRFWEETLGLFHDKLGLPMKEEADNYIEFCNENSSITLIKVKDNDVKAVPGDTGIMFECPKLDHTIKEMESRSLKFVSKKEKTVLGTSIKFQDPNGNTYHLLQRK